MVNRYDTQYHKHSEIHIITHYNETYFPIICIWVRYIDTDKNNKVPAW